MSSVACAPAEAAIVPVGSRCRPSPATTTGNGAPRKRFGSLSAVRSSTDSFTSTTWWVSPSDCGHAVGSSFSSSSWSVDARAYIISRCAPLGAAPPPRSLVSPPPNSSTGIETPLRKFGRAGRTPPSRASPSARRAPGFAEHRPRRPRRASTAGPPNDPRGPFGPRARAAPRHASRSARGLCAPRGAPSWGR